MPKENTPENGKLNQDESQIATKVSDISDFDHDIHILDNDDKTFAMLAHLAAFSFYITGIGLIVGPLLVWLLKKDKSPYIDHHGKESLNFQISYIIYSTAVLATLIIPLLGVLINIILLPLLNLAWIIFIVIATIKANDGERYCYPCTLRFIK